MASYTTAVRRPPQAAQADLGETPARSVRRRIYVAWGLLFFNTMTYTPGYSILDIPSRIGKGVAQGVLPLAIVLILSVNPKLKFRPNVFLCIISLLIVDTVFTAIQVHHVGTAFRTFRLAEFVGALWLLTPWWGRSDMMLLRVHLRCLYIALGTVFIGLLVAPGRAFAYDGRLTGVLWPMLPTQIAQYAAVAIGLVVVLWLGRQLSGRATLVGVAFSLFILLLTHTRTALVAGAAGIFIAGLSLFVVNARVRKFFTAAAAVVVIGVTAAAGVVSTWLVRGENAQGLTTLTGRTNFWGLVLATPRTKFQEIFGFGLSNASINGLPIDSNWLASYMQEGLFGVITCSLIMVFLFTVGFMQPPGIKRALILFILTYCLVASFTEDAFTDVSPYLLHLTVAASLFIFSSKILPARQVAPD
jgi:hypothetical protein